MVGYFTTKLTKSFDYFKLKNNKCEVYIYDLNSCKEIKRQDGTVEYEYIINHFIDEGLTLEMVSKNPTNYLNYKVQPKLSFEELQIDINIDTDYRLSMLELGI